MKSFFLNNPKKKDKKNPTKLDKNRKESKKKVLSAIVLVFCWYPVALKLQPDHLICIFTHYTIQGADINIQHIASKISYFP